MDHQAPGKPNTTCPPGDTLGSRFPPGTSVGFLNLHRACENSSNLLARVRKFLVLGGYPLRPTPADADLVIVNTCVVTDAMKIANEQAIIELRARCPNTDILVLGCLAGMAEAVCELPSPGTGRVIFVDPQQVSLLDDLFYADVSIAAVHTEHLVDFDAYQPGMTASDRFLMISQGCVHRCTFCNIRRAKGAVVSRTIAELVDEVRKLICAGPGEIVLLSDDCGSYGIDLGVSLADLLDALAQLDGTLRIKIYTIFPKLLLEHYARLRPHIAAGRITYLCVPVQSGAPRILKQMARAVDLQALRETLAEVRSLAPHLQLYSHFIIGFPGETDSEFEASIDFARHFDDCLFITYGDNEKTPASRILPKSTSLELTARRGRLATLLARHELRGVVV